MPERLTVYQAADGSIHETEENARVHDLRNAVTREAKEFCAERISHRTVQKSKVEKLMIEFAMKLLTPVPHAGEHHEDS